MNRENRLNSFCQVRAPFTLREKSCVLPAHLFREPALLSHTSFLYLFQSIPLHFSPTIISTLKKSRSFRRDINKYIHKTNSPHPSEQKTALSHIHLYTIVPPIGLSSIPRHLLFLPIWIPAVATLLWAFKKYVYSKRYIEACSPCMTPPHPPSPTKHRHSWSIPSFSCFTLNHPEKRKAWE